MHIPVFWVQDKYKNFVMEKSFMETEKRYKNNTELKEHDHAKMRRE